MRYAPGVFGCVALACLVGCAEQKAQTERQKEAPKPKQALTWKELPELPNPLGFGGPFAGTSGGALIVAGGAHFPVSLFEGGTKVWVDSIFVLEPGEPAWHTGFRLDRPLAYGASISANDGFYLLGGCDAERCYADCALLKWVKGKIEKAPLPPLPEPCAMTSAAIVGKTIYVAGGQASPKATSALKSFWALNVSEPDAGWQEIRAWPGPARILAVAAAREGNFYLFSGAELYPDDEGNVKRKYLADAYRYNAMTGWTKLADMPRPAVAAPSPAMPFGTSQILVFGGDDGANADKVLELKDDHPGFLKSILAYDVNADRWTQMGEVPAAHVTTALTWWQGMHVIPSGEIRPGVRSPRVYGVRPAE